MEPEQIITIICAIIASSGFWHFIDKRSSKSDAQSDMLMGLAHDRILQLGNEYLDRGYITSDEYDNLYNYLYCPYHEGLNGNGTAELIVRKCGELPIFTTSSENVEK